MSTKRVCDKCGKDLTNKPYWDILANKYGPGGQNWIGTNDRTVKRFDLCEDCMKQIESSLTSLVNK